MEKNNGGFVNESYVGSIEMLSTSLDNNRNSNGSAKFEGENKVIGSAKSEGENKDEPIIKEKERPVWSNSMEFLMSCIAMSVGLGNIWRFPFTAYENGGGAFLIPYIIVLIIIGKPMYYLEMAIGQFTSRSSVKIWEVSPILRGVGIGQMVATSSVITYYTSLIALTLYFLFHSFVSELPWDKCYESWTDCVNSNPNINQYFNNLTKNITELKSSSELYFSKIVLKETDNITNGIGLPDWQLSLWLFCAWIVIFLVIIRGVKSSGKVAYFLAIFPYVIIITLLVRAVTLDGALDGILFFFKPQWNQLLSPKVWYAATTQLFFSLSVGMGTIVMFSSYNQFSHNIYRDAVIVTTLDTFTSLLGGMTIFGILGNLAHNLDKDIKDVVQGGAKLAFISYPDAISKFDVVPQLFSILFFFMLFTLGIGSVVALHSALTTVIFDQFPKLKYWKIALATSIAGFLIGLIYVTPGGQWMLSLVDHFGGTFLIFVLAIIELIGIFWIYGLENFCLDLEFMTGRRVTFYWRFCWAILTPCFMIVIFIYSMINLESPKYSNIDFPDSALAAGWVLFLIGILQLPLWAVWLIVKNKDLTLIESCKNVFKPTKFWGPKDSKIKNEWIKFKLEAIDNRQKIALTNSHSLLKQKLFILLGKYR